MKTLLITLLLLPFSLTAETFKIAGAFYDFQVKDGLLLNGCEKDCLALKAVKKYRKINVHDLKRKSGYVNSIGSDVCSQVYKAQSNLGIAKNQDRRAFCRFPDGSTIEMNSLSSYLLENQLVKGIQK